MNERIDYIKKIRKIVVKVGSSTLEYPNGHLNIGRIEKIVRQLSDIHNRGIQVILVTSGAIGAGMGKLGFDKKPDTIPEKQAAAAVGQGMLLHMYEKLFSEYGKSVAQILLTKDDVTHRKRFLNVRNAFFTLLDKGIIPIINENDAVVVDEIKIGENDTLSALVSGIVEADLLIILSDIDGLYDSNPSENKEAKLINFVPKIDKKIKNCAGGSSTKVGTGGMITKIKAAVIATSSGTPMVIANGKEENIIEKVLEGKEIGTWFKENMQPMHARKRWIAFSSDTKGKIVIDKGAEDAVVLKHKSLLASGITEVEGSFEEGSVLSIVNSEGKEIAKGMVNYSSDEINIIKGLKSNQFEKKLGYKNYDEVIHRNNMVVF